jgi:hypothetical protein
VTPDPDLRRLCARSQTRLSKVRGRVGHVIASGGAGLPGCEETLGHCVLELQTLWANFVRAFLLSLLYMPRTRSGPRAFIQDASIATPGALIHAAARATRGPWAAAPLSRRDEPTWHDTNVFLKTMRAIKASNTSRVESALSIPARALHDMHVFRNFYAHRNEDASRRAVQLASTYYSLPSYVRRPSEALLSASKGRPQCVLLDWFDEVDVIVELTCE